MARLQMWIRNYRELRTECEYYEPDVLSFRSLSGLEITEIDWNLLEKRDQRCKT